jgi:predicted nucleic acid-binding protein
LDIADENFKITEAAIALVESYQEIGVKEMDSYHIAVAIDNGCDVFLTTDDRFLKKVKKLGLQISAENPATWILEVI